MSRPQLSAQPREVHGKAVKRLRRRGLLPGVVFGHGVESRSVQFDAHEFELLRRRAGRNALLDLTLDGDRPLPVLVQAVQEHPVSRAPLHVDLMAVRMTEELTVDVPIVFVGESPAVERMGGVLLHLRENVQVRALPDRLPPALELDVSPLDSFDAVLHVSDLRVPEGATLLTDGAETIARVQPPRVEEVPVPAEEAPEAIEAAEAAEAVRAAEGGTGEGGEPA
ncbi:MAG: 50S ribosomal protein L25 [Chloroflexota bacterium]|nr:50S ribosomal protein L25 [Chloroflexota bacterium]